MTLDPTTLTLILSVLGLATVGWLTKYFVPREIYQKDQEHIANAFNSIHSAQKEIQHDIKTLLSKH